MAHSTPKITKDRQTDSYTKRYLSIVTVRFITVFPFSKVKNFLVLCADTTTECVTADCKPELHPTLKASNYARNPLSPAS